MLDPFRMYRYRALYPVNKKHSKHTQSGNILLIILLAIVLIGALTVAIQGANKQNAAIDKELLALKVAEVKRHAAEIERGVSFILRNGKSESDLRFSHPNADADYGDLTTDSDKSDQVFDKEGGSASYRPPSALVNDGSRWEFYGNTALPEVGSDAAELIAVLPNITPEFCKAMNTSLGYGEEEQPQDDSGCLNAGASDRFGDNGLFSPSPDGVREETFTKRPSMQGCIRCDGDAYHYFHVLMAR